MQDVNELTTALDKLVRKALIDLDDKPEVVIINSNHRFVPRGELSFWDWNAACRSARTSLSELLGTVLSRHNAALPFRVRHRTDSFSGFLGVASNTSVVLFKE